MKKLNYKILIFSIIFFGLLYKSLKEIQKRIEKKVEYEKRLAEILAVEKMEEYLDEAYQYNWDHEMIQTFEQTLGLKSNDENKDPCPFTTKHVVSALSYPETTLESYVWTYFSLYSLSSVEYLKPVITEKIHNLLVKLFDKIEVPVINEISRKCYELENTIILGYSDNVMNVKPITTPFLLEENGMRFKEVLKIQQKDLKLNFKFTKDLHDRVYKEMLVDRDPKNINRIAIPINYVGIFVDETNEVKATKQYFDDAIRYTTKINKNSIFLLICDVSKPALCSKKFKPSEDATVNNVRFIKRQDEAFNFALMASCNQTIISNTAGALHAIYNQGNATVFRPKYDYERMYYIPLLMSKKLPKWHVIK